MPLLHSILTLDRLESLLAKRLLSDECGYCFNGLNSNCSVIYMCLSCGESYCTSHFSIHSSKYSHLIAAATTPFKELSSVEEILKKPKVNSNITVDVVNLENHLFIPYETPDLPVRNIF